MAASDTTAWPTELRLTEAGRVLRVSFDDGTALALAAELLRVSSPSAEVQGHAPADRKTVAGKRNIAISGIEAVGNYAVKLSFDDGHDTGLFTWRFLHDLGGRAEAAWSAYVEELGRTGLSRE